MTSAKMTQAERLTRIETLLEADLSQRAAEREARRKNDPERDNVRSLTPYFGQMIPFGNIRFRA